MVGAEELPGHVDRDIRGRPLHERGDTRDVHDHVLRRGHSRHLGDRSCIADIHGDRHRNGRFGEVLEVHGHGIARHVGTGHDVCRCRHGDDHAGDYADRNRSCENGYAPLDGFPHPCPPDSSVSSCAGPGNSFGRKSRSVSAKVEDWEYACNAHFAGVRAARIGSYRVQSTRSVPSPYAIRVWYPVTDCHPGSAGARTGGVCRFCPLSAATAAGIGLRDRATTTNPIEPRAIATALRSARRAEQSRAVRAKCSADGARYPHGCEDVAGSALGNGQRCARRRCAVSNEPVAGRTMMGLHPSGFAEVFAGLDPSPSRSARTAASGVRHSRHAVGDGRGRRRPGASFPRGTAAFPISRAPRSSTPGHRR